MSGPNLLPIGTFARACKLTVKALRHYDQLGLLRPAHVDAATGYRYYRQEQARTAITIGLLRSIDVPLATIRTVLTSDEPTAKAALDEQRERLARDRTRIEHAILLLDHYLDAGATLAGEVRLRFEPAVSLASVRLAVPTHDEVAATHRAFADLTATLDQTDGGWTEPALTIVGPTTGDTLTIEVCLGFPGDPTVLPDPVRHRELPASPVIETLHHGPYETAGLAHAAVHAWAQEHGHHPAGPLREIYLNDPATTPTADLLTRVLMPVPPSD